MVSMDSDQFKNNIETTFNDVSSRYDENKFFSISATRMVEFVPSLGGMNLLDVSTGTGVVAIEVAKQYPDANIEAVDISSGMLQQAKAKAQQEGLQNIVFKKCDVENIAYPDEVFDVVTCGYALFFYPDMEAAYQKICRTIRSGGLFIFSSFTNKAFNPYAELFLNRLEADYKIEAPSRLRERLKTEKQIEELAAVNSHKRVRVEHFPISYSITISEWWSLLNNAGYKALLDQLSSEQLLCFKDDHLAEIESISVDGAIELNTDTLYGIVQL